MKRLLSVLILLAVVLPVAFSVLPEGSFCRSDFLKEEAGMREKALDEACLLSDEVFDSRFFTSVGEEKRYILRFSERVGEAELQTVLEGLDARLLGDPAESVYSVCLDDADAFCDDLGDKLIYCCPDEVRYTAALPNDPLLKKQTSFAQMELFSAWELVTVDRDITVAVLDTGVDREHEDLSGVAILNGYDAVTGQSGVSFDADGHGTAVIGLIASASGNGVGACGVAPGVKILPIRVTRSSNTVFSSDLIRGIRFAADAGAKILNLSLGGYTASVAEEDAVRYALQKGCILIAASGNDGETDMAKKEIYPASYEGVISVGSCDANGVRSSFSQKTARTDLLAPGEDLVLLSNGGEYIIDGGTSYSAALVSGIAVLALSALNAPVRFTGEELLSLLADDRSKATDGSGYGEVNALSAVQKANQPLITGVEQGKTYSGRVCIRFNRGSARLDGEEFESGGMVFRNGSHTLVVTERSFYKSITFRLQYTPSEYEIIRGEDFFYVNYTNGNATLNGMPYPSGEKVTAPGEYRFVLTDPVGDVRSETIHFDPDAPLCSGVEDGKTYDRPVWIRLCSVETAVLDGMPFGNEGIVSEDGAHTLVLQNGSKTQTVRFTLHTGKTDLPVQLPYCKLIVDEVNGWYALYGEMLLGVRVYDLYTNAFLGVVEAETVLHCTLTKERLVLFCEGEVAFTDPARMKNGDMTAIKYALPSSAAVWFDGTVWFLGYGNLYRFSAEDQETVWCLRTEADGLYSDGDALWLYTSKTGVTERYDGAVKTQAVLPLAPTDAKKIFSDGYLFCDGRALSLNGTQTDFAYEGDVLAVFDGKLYCERYVYDLASGVCVGGYDRVLSDAVRSEKGYYLCCRSGGIVFYPHEGYAATPSETVRVRSVEPYSTLVTLFGETENACTASSGGYYALALQTMRRLVLLRGGTVLSEYALPFAPDGICMNGAECALWSASEGMVWIDGNVFSFAFPVKNVFFTQNTWFVLSGNALFRLEDGRMKNTNITASVAIGAKDMLCYCDGTVLTVETLTASRSFACTTNTLWTDGEILLTDTDLYRLDRELSITKQTAVPGTVLAVANGMVLTENGLLSPDGTLLKTDLPRGRSYFLSSVCGIGVFDEKTLYISSFAHPLWEEPIVEGLPEPGDDCRQVTPVFDRGIAFLDGTPFTSGQTVQTPGTHLLTLVLPGSVVWEYPFSVVPAMQSLYFTDPIYRLSAGETGALRLQYAPAGTQRIPVVYSCDGKCIRLYADGRFLALEDGEVTVKATTTDGKFSATCRVIVTGTLLHFSEGSGYETDRVNRFLLNVAPGTSAQTLIAQVISNGEAKLSTPFAGTGSVLTLYGENGEVLDELTVVVRGDLDGDGFRTYDDLALLETYLVQGFENDLLSLAGDVNASGRATDWDANRLRQHLQFGYGEYAAPPADSECTLELVYSAPPYLGDLWEVTLYLRGECADVYGISGRLLFDPNALVLQECVGYGFTLTENVGNDFFTFRLSDAIAETERPVLTLRFSVAGQTALRLSDVCILRSGTPLGAAKQAVDVGTSARMHGELSFSVVGMDGSFAPDVTEYNAYLPAGTPNVSYTLIYPNGWECFVQPTVFDRVDRMDTILSVRNGDGTETLYTVHMFRDGTRPKSGESRLATLAVEEVVFDFSPERTEYDFTVPNEIAMLTLHPTAMDPNASVAYDELMLTPGKETEIRLTVTAEDGTQTVYVLRVFREEEVIPVDPTSSEEEASSVSKEPSETVSEESGVTMSSEAEESLASEEKHGKFPILPVVSVVALAGIGIGYFIKRKGRK